LLSASSLQMRRERPCLGVLRRSRWFRPDDVRGAFGAGLPWWWMTRIRRAGSGH